MFLDQTHTLSAVETQKMLCYTVVLDFHGLIFENEIQVYPDNGNYVALLSTNNSATQSETRDILTLTVEMFPSNSKG